MDRRLRLSLTSCVSNFRHLSYRMITSDCPLTPSCHRWMPTVSPSGLLTDKFHARGVEEAITEASMHGLGVREVLALADTSPIAVRPFTMGKWRNNACRFWPQPSRPPAYPSPHTTTI